MKSLENLLSQWLAGINIPQSLKELWDVISGIGVKLNIGDIDLTQSKLLCFNHPHVYSPSKIWKKTAI
jgi:hypothetical protein